MPANHLVGGRSPGRLSRLSGVHFSVRRVRHRQELSHLEQRRSVHEKECFAFRE